MVLSDIVESVATCAGVSKVQARRCIACYHDAISKGLKRTGKVSMVGFGTFAKVRRKARTGRNPQTGEVIKIKAANVVKFRPGKGLRDTI
jgi:DNA-binding protein HU-beta